MYVPAVLIGAGIAALLIKAFSEDEAPKSKNDKKKLFISFAIEDEKYRDFLVAQAKNERTPFYFRRYVSKATLGRKSMEAEV